MSKLDFSKIETPYLSKTEEYELISKAQSGCIKSQNNLVTSNLKYLHKNAKYYSRYTKCNLEEVFQECICGFITAIHKFKAEKDVRLITFANFYIKLAADEVSAKDRMIPVTKYVFSHTKKNEEFNFTSFPICDEDPIPQEIFEDGFDHCSNNEYSILIKNILKNLSKFERTVVQHLFGMNGYEELGKKEIAEKYNTTFSKVCTATADAYAKSVPLFYNPIKETLRSAS